MPSSDDRQKLDAVTARRCDAARDEVEEEQEAPHQYSMAD